MEEVEIDQNEENNQPRKAKYAIKVHVTYPVLKGATSV